MKQKTILQASLLVLAMNHLTACSHLEWRKSGGTQQVVAQDKLECPQRAIADIPTYTGVDIMMATSPANTSGIVQTKDLNSHARRDYFNSCMQARGWSLVSVPN